MITDLSNVSVSFWVFTVFNPIKGLSFLAPAVNFDIFDALFAQIYVSLLTQDFLKKLSKFLILIFYHENIYVINILADQVCPQCFDVLKKMAT